MALNEKKISTLSQVSLLGTFSTIDAIQGITKLLHITIPVVGSIAAILIGILLSIIALTIFSIWLPVIGVPLFNGIPMLMATMIMELIPIINALPGWTTLVIATIFVVNRKAKYNKKKNNESV